MGIIKDPTSWRTGFELGLAGFSFPYSKPRRKPTAYLYNGVRFPALPEWEGYDYVFIVYKEEQNNPYLIASTVPLVANKGTVSVLGEMWWFHFSDAGSDLRCYYSESKDIWLGINHSHNNAEAGDETYTTSPPVWSNYTIYDITTGEILMEKSADPVPVYE